MHYVKSANALWLQAILLNISNVYMPQLQHLNQPKNHDLLLKLRHRLDINRHQKKRHEIIYDWKIY